jgi:hypothetical protein
LPAGHVEMSENDALARVPRGNLSQLSLHLSSGTMIFSGFHANKNKSRRLDMTKFKKF